MGKPRARVLLACCAAVCATALGATTALAATTWTITPGGAFTVSGTKVVVTDTKTGTNIPCHALAARGRLKSGSGLSGPGAGSITAVTISTCTGPIGVTFTLTATDLPWLVNLTSYSGGVVKGSISHVQIHLSGPSCTAVIDGTSATASDGILRFRYTDGTGSLKILTTGGNLHFYNVSGCLGLFNTGDPATISGTFTLSPKQVITSP